MTKIIAFYLPQYHEIKENDEWWGKGFTEWTNVRRSKPLYEGHMQPRYPLNNYFYDLMDKKTIEKQTQLANDYGIDGFAYYHYWFNGDMLLEKPAENLLKWKDIKQNFFFFWANHSWYKAEKGRKILLKKQTYGGESDWKNHFDYMLKFFCDERYIKVDNKPVLGIYIPQDIPDYNEMVCKINFWCQEAGFNGIYIINSLMDAKKINNNDDALKNNDAILYRQPNISMYMTIKQKKITRIKNKVCRFFNRPYLIRYTYDDIVDKEENIDSYLDETYNKERCFCMSTGWDNTSRHGHRGSVIDGFSIERFQACFRKLYARSNSLGNRFLFLNAWNEWAEGMVLEPDNIFGYRILEAIKTVKDSYLLNSIRD